jgi:predicted transcriptional regulator
MLTRITPREFVDVLLRRSEVIESLLESPMDKPALVDNLDLSRSTVDRAVSELQSLTLVAHSDDGVESTVCGRLAVEEYRQLEARVTDLWSETDEHSVPGTRLTELLRGVDRITCLGRANSYAPAITVIHTLVVKEGVRMEAVFPTELLEFQRSANLEKLTQIIEQEHSEMFIVEETPFGLFIGETGDKTWVCLGVHDGENNLKGVIVNTSAEAVKWGERTYRTYATRAEPIPC